MFESFLRENWVVILLVAVAAVLVIAILKRYGAPIRKFTSEVRVELGKAQWPWDPNEKGFRRYKELTDSTVVVLVAMTILGGYIAFFDFILINVVSYMTHP
ncbi:MAG: preprotein translocase subunit SecE [Verrucomicrobiae bacterium]